MRVFTIARNTFREAIHLPVLYVIVGASAVLLVIVGQLPRFTLSVYGDLKALLNLSVATATLAGMLVAVFATMHVVTAEIKNWTVVTVLSKPVRRWEFIVGKFLGITYLLTALYAVLTVVYTLITWWGMWANIANYGHIYDELKAVFPAIRWQAADILWRAMALCLLQTIALAAVAVVACVRAPMVISAVLFFMAFVLGHFVDKLFSVWRGAETASQHVLGAAAALIALVLPDLEATNFMQELENVDLERAFRLAEPVGSQVAPLGVLGWAALYTACYAAAALIAAFLLFRNREVL